VAQAVECLPRKYKALSSLKLFKQMSQNFLVVKFRAILISFWHVTLSSPSLCDAAHIVLLF
jgi:hypothetical protein